MFDIAWSELLLVVIVAILVVGPKELPALLRNLGRMLGKLRSTADEFRKQFDDAVKEAGGEDLQREMRSFKQNNPLNQIRDSIEEVGRNPLEAGSSKSSPQTDPDDDDDDEDGLGRPPPLPPRSASSKSAAQSSSEPNTPSAGTPSPSAVQPPSPPSKEMAAGDDGNDIRVNGEHRATG